MNCTLLCLYFRSVPFWHKILVLLFFLCILVLFLLTLTNLTGTHFLTVGATGLPPSTDPGGGGPW